MKPHEERVVKEKAELDRKIKKISSFIFHSYSFSSLFEEEDRKLLKLQLSSMEIYSHVLGMRIARFKIE